MASNVYRIQWHGECRQNTVVAGKYKAELGTEAGGEVEPRPDRLHFHRKKGQVFVDRNRLALDTNHVLCKLSSRRGICRYSRLHSQGPAQVSSETRQKTTFQFVLLNDSI